MRSRLLLACALTLLSAGCREARRKTIAVIPKGTSHLFWVSVHAGAAAAGEEYKVDVLWNGPAQETEYDRQIQIVDSMIARHVDAIAVAPSERKALVRSVDRAADEKIPVCVFDSGIDTDRFTTFLATNNQQAGQMAARELGKLLGGKGTVAVVMHAPGSGSTMDRESGFAETIAKELPGISIVAKQYGMSDRSRAMAAAENILTAHPNLNGIFASSEPSSVGTALALKSRGLSGKVKFVAFDSSDGMIEDVRGGTIHAMVVQDPFGMGHEIVRVLVEKLSGKGQPKRIDLQARVVERGDLDKPDVAAVLRPDVKRYLK